MATYAVTWEESTRATRAGRLDLGRDALKLSAGANGRAVELVVPYTAIGGVSLVREPAARLRGRPTIVLARRDGTDVRIAIVAQSWLLAELAERLGALGEADAAALQSSTA